MDEEYHAGLVNFGIPIGKLSAHGDNHSILGVDVFDARVNAVAASYDGVVPSVLVEFVIDSSKSAEKLAEMLKECFKAECKTLSFDEFNAKVVRCVPKFKPGRQMLVFMILECCGFDDQIRRVGG